MGMFSFIKEAGEKLFGIGEAKAAEVAAKANPTPVNVDAANAAAAKAIANYVAKMNLTAEGLDIGTAPSRRGCRAASKRCCAKCAPGIRSWCCRTSASIGIRPGITPCWWATT